MDNTLSSRRLAVQLIAVALVILLLAMGVLWFFAYKIFEHQLEPEIERKIVTVAQTTGAVFKRAANLNIPAEDLRGIDDYLSETIRSHPEIRYVGFVDPAGKKLLGAAGDLRELRTDTALAPVHAHFSQATNPNSLGRMQAVGAYLELVWPVEAADGHRYGTLHLGTDASFVREKLQEIFADALITLFVSVLITLEVLFLLMTLMVTRPVSLLGRLISLGRGSKFNSHAVWQSRDELGQLIATSNRTIQYLNERYHAIARRAETLRGAAGNAVGDRISSALGMLNERFHFDGKTGLTELKEISARDIRLPLFVYLFGTELSRSFFPIYVRESYHQHNHAFPFLPESVVIALPMSVWVVAMIIATPLGTSLGRRLGVRGVSLVGMAVSAIGLFLTGYAAGIYQLLVWRCVTAAGFGAVTVAALQHIADTTPAQRRARGMGIFVGAMIGASVCGSSIGGILANHLGKSETFYVAAGLVCLAAILVFRFLESESLEKPPNGQNRKVPAGGFFRILCTWRGAVLVFFSAIPAKIMLTGFLFYFTPLYLSALRFDTSAIGRIMMCYFVVMYLMSPLVSEIADRWGAHRLMLVAGGFCSSLGALAFLYSASAWMMIVAGVVLIGLGQSLITTPQLALLPSVFRNAYQHYGSGSVLAAFRIVERIGSFSGPLICAALLSLFGFADAARDNIAAAFEEAAKYIGIIMLLLSAALALFLTLSNRAPDPVAD